MRRLSPVFLAAATACAKAPPPRAPAPPPPPPAPASTGLAALDPETRFECDAIKPDPRVSDAHVVECLPGGGACELAYIARKMTSSPAGYLQGEEVAVTAQASRWRVDLDGERLHVEIADGAGTALIVDGALSGAAGSEGTIAREYVGVARTPGANAAPARAVSIAGAPTTPQVTRDEARVAVSCALVTDLQE
jgi:hypothetical protein